MKALFGMPSLLHCHFGALWRKPFDIKFAIRQYVRMRLMDYFTAQKMKLSAFAATLGACVNRHALDARRAPAEGRCPD
jgi:hypothetical protein